MLHWVHQFSDLTILFGFLIVMLSTFSTAPLLISRVFRLKPNEPREKAALEGFRAICGMIGIVLGFSLVQANGNLASGEAHVVKTASLIQAIDRNLLRSGNSELVALRPALAAYGRSLIDDEWPKLAKGERSAKTTEAYTVLSKSIRSVDVNGDRAKSIFEELMRQLDDLADIRETIIATAEPSTAGLPSFFWITILSMLSISLLLAGFCAPNISGIVSIGATASAMSLLLSFLIIADLPFEGQTSVSPTAIKNALVLNAQRK